MALLFAFLFATNMSEYGAACFAIAAMIAMSGIGLGARAWHLVKVKKLGVRPVLIMQTGLLIVIVVAGMSMFVSGRVTYARFGLTVYGLIPVPGFDIQVSGAGLLGLRDKSHLVSAHEVRKLARPGVEAVVIGIGWDGVVRVDPAVAAIKGVEIYQLPTPEAIALFNRLKAEGRRVALLAHSTC